MRSARGPLPVTQINYLKGFEKGAKNLTALSTADKYPAGEDGSIERLLDLDEQIFAVGEGHWVQIRAKRVPPTEAKPHGIDYSLCLHAPDGGRLVCYDNAHPVRSARPPAGKMSERNDHRHKGDVVSPYAFVNAEGLMNDFWTDVYEILREKGIP
jgi:Family of unknown function (DUF6516)